MDKPELIRVLGKDMSTVPNRKGVYRCCCGAEFVFIMRYVQRGKTLHCGCHGLGELRHDVYFTRLCNVWRGILQRCNDKRNEDYGGRGISVCAKWLSFENFYFDMRRGYSSGLFIDRIDPDGNYEPDNCRWLTPSESSRNKRKSLWKKKYVYNGVLTPIHELSKISGFSNKLLKMRIEDYGWSVEDAVHTPKINIITDRDEAKRRRSDKAAKMREWRKAEGIIW